MQTIKTLLTVALLASCGSSQANKEPGNQWAALPVLYAESIGELCPAPYTCEKQVSSFISKASPFQGGMLNRTNETGQAESPLIALTFGNGWYGITPENTPPKEKDKTSSVAHTFSSFQSKTIQQRPTLFIQGTRRESVFCETCANPIAKTTPGTVYESEFFKICALTQEKKILCTDTFDSDHNQDGPTKLSVEFKDDGAVQLKAPAWRFTKEGRVKVEPGTYTVFVP